MKDKRQRMALAWPYADPQLAAYMLNAAAAAGVSGTYPYPGLAAAMPGLNYYTHLSLANLQRGPFHPYATASLPGSGALHGRTDLMSIARSPLALRSDMTATTLTPSHIPSSQCTIHPATVPGQLTTPADLCGCHIFPTYSGIAAATSGANTTLQRPLTITAPNTTREPGSLFQPYVTNQTLGKQEVEQS